MDELAKALNLRSGLPQRHVETTPKESPYINGADRKKWGRELGRKE